MVTAGDSLNGRPITGIHFWGSSGKGKPAVVFHGTVHAREWISTMVCMFWSGHRLRGRELADAESRSWNTSPTRSLRTRTLPRCRTSWTNTTLCSSPWSTQMVNHTFAARPNLSWGPLVVTGMLGFVYSQTTDRMWRKNRQTVSGSSCVGHDINRNWPYQWSISGGASTNPCAQDFKGRREGDAPETAALSSWLRTVRANQGLKLYIDWHSYSQLFMTRKPARERVLFPVTSSY